MEKYINQIINADCLDILKNIPDNYFDLCLTDPPYGIGEAKKDNASRGKLAIAKDYGKKDWDNKIPSKEIFDEIFRVSKNQIIFGNQILQKISFVLKLQYYKLSYLLFYLTYYQEIH